MSFAKVTIVGRLGRDPETRYTPSGALNVQFSMAADGRRRSGGQEGQEQDNTTWFRVTAWDRQAERLVTLIERGYIGKGRLLYVEGQLESRQYTDNSGQQRTSLDVTMSDFQFIGSRQDNQQGGGGNQGGNYGGDNYGSNYGGGQEINEGDDDLNSVPF